MRNALRKQEDRASVKRETEQRRTEGEKRAGKHGRPNITHEACKRLESRGCLRAKAWPRDGGTRPVRRPKSTHTQKASPSEAHDSAQRTHAERAPMSKDEPARLWGRRKQWKSLRATAQPVISDEVGCYERITRYARQATRLAIVRQDRQGKRDVGEGLQSQENTQRAGRGWPIPSFLSWGCCARKLIDRYVCNETDLIFLGAATKMKDYGQ